MSAINVSGRLPDGDGNGLAAIAGQLIKEGKGDVPRGLHLCLALVDCAKVVINGDTHETVPVARIRRIEVIITGEDRKLAEDLMRRALERRTGQETLPYDLELELRDVVDNADLDTPEPEQPELPLGEPEDSTDAHGNDDDVDTAAWPDDPSELAGDDDDDA